jgi:uncharacterized protein involved in exopolysaccharide biosynthesis
MTQPISSSSPIRADADDEISLLGLASALLRWRRPIIVLGLVGAAIGLALGLTGKRLYKSTVTFIPQGSESGASGLLAAVGQLGIRIPTSSTAWGPALYVEVLQSRALLERLAFDTVIVAEERGRRAVVADLLEIDAPTQALRADHAVRALRGIVRGEEVKSLGAVRLSVATRWPSVSLALAEALVREVNHFNFQTRKSQAAAERQFVEAQSNEAQRSLLAAEERLQAFLERNRSISGSPELGFTHDRLQREVGLRQQLYSALLQSREDARIREIRDIPVITVLEEPALPLVGESRGTLQKAVLGGFAGGLLGVVIAFAVHGLSRARGMPSDEAREFFRLVDESTPRFLRKARR